MREAIAWTGSTIALVATTLGLLVTGFALPCIHDDCDGTFLAIVPLVALPLCAVGAAIAILAGRRTRAGSIARWCLVAMAVEIIVLFAIVN